MKKMIIVVLVSVLALALAGAGLAANPATKSQTVCPVLGNKINKDIHADYHGQRVYFCCPACVAPFQKEPEKYLKKMKDQGVTPEKAPASK